MPSAPLARSTPTSRGRRPRGHPHVDLDLRCTLTYGRPTGMEVAWGVSTRLVFKTTKHQVVGGTMQFKLKLAEPGAGNEIYIISGPAGWLDDVAANLVRLAPDFSAKRVPWRDDKALKEWIKVTVCAFALLHPKSHYKEEQPGAEGAAQSITAAVRVPSSLSLPCLAMDRAAVAPWS